MIFQNELFRLSQDAGISEFFVSNFGVEGEDYDTAESFSTTELSFPGKRFFPVPEDVTESESIDACPPKKAKLNEVTELDEETFNFFTKEFKFIQLNIDLTDDVDPESKEFQFKSKLIQFLREAQNLEEKQCDILKNTNKVEFKICGYYIYICFPALTPKFLKKTYCYQFGGDCNWLDELEKALIHQRYELMNPKSFFCV
eukprot:GHVP01057638.1.p1 GENE.GHVP01057638.1~~GHVP01057638.1.p1  ORF type:complete len:200 (+),score=47.92 GHVP01057638.1:161-760(+)